MSVGRSAGLAIAAGIAIGAACGASAISDEPAATIRTETGPSGSRPLVGAGDLVGLRDFGPLAGPANVPPPFALSPDGRSIALELRQADPASNRYRLALMLIPLDGTPRTLSASGGDLIRDNAANRQMGDVPRGWPRATPPVWSPDGMHVAWLRRFGDRTDIWIVGRDGRDARQVTRAADDVRSLAWSSNGRAIVYATQPAIREAWARIAVEGRAGWPYDARFWPVAAEHPWPTAPFPLQFDTVDLASQTVRAATPAERSRLDPTDGLPTGATSGTASPEGSVAWTAATDPTALVATETLHVLQADRERPIPAMLRGRIVGLWWTGHGRTLLALRQEGVETGDRLTLVRWTIGRRPSVILSTTDLLQGCAVARDHDLICAREGSLFPRRIDRIDAKSGETKTIYDPNPAFGKLSLGPATRLIWRNGFGRSSFGDLVLPPDHRPGQRHPLIVVQYSTRGFLRGGTGDEYPIQLFAAHGFAVLSFERPPDVAEEDHPRTAAEWERIDFRDWADRRNVQSSLEGGIRLAVDMGVADPERIGITGLSEGATTAVWALVHSHFFKAASLSGCCATPEDFSDIGPVYGDEIASYGYPRRGSDTGGFWKAYSIAENSEQIPPLLLQLVSTEFREALAPVDALRSTGRAVDMLVFPDEYHVKWQPAHRLAIYRRNVCWFEYWLSTPRADVCDAADLRRWAALPHSTDAP